MRKSIPTAQNISAAMVKMTTHIDFLFNAKPPYIAELKECSGAGKLGDNYGIAGYKRNSPL
ncbi:MAG: hypothetical protein ACLRIN_10910 [Lawsonibacter sp.]|nr:hypothetical protein [Oscillospiraceae bacterium]